MRAISRNYRKTLIGYITKRSGNKTVKVTYACKIPHPRYNKEINRRTILHVHDSNNQCEKGDKVMIMEVRPISKLKRFRIVKVFKK